MPWRTYQTFPYATYFQDLISSYSQINCEFGKLKTEGPETYFMIKACIRIEKEVRPVSQDLPRYAFLPWF